MEVIISNVLQNMSHSEVSGIGLPTNTGLHRSSTRKVRKRTSSGICELYTGNSMLHYFKYESDIIGDDSVVMFGNRLDSSELLITNSGKTTPTKASSVVVM